MIMKKFRYWIQAIRLRTLPLAVSSIGMGSFLAAYHQTFYLEISLLCIVTAILLQIISNLANDYGDSMHGVDNQIRKGPQRIIQHGYISTQSMRYAIYFFSLLSLGIGLWLLYIALSWDIKFFAFFLVLGIIAIIAALTYTLGPKPYGYIGLGDLSVVVFFGWIAVLGVYFLSSKNFKDYSLFLPATSCGLFSTAVLNINNIRDIESDKIAGKISIPVRLGKKKSVVYHWCLLLGGIFCALLFTAIHYQSIIQLFFLICFPLLIRNGKAIGRIQIPTLLNRYLKQMVLINLLFVISFGVGLLVSNQI